VPLIEGKDVWLTIVTIDGLTKLFQEIKQKKTLEELSPEYKKFAEWVRIE
jgi:uncharacterized protein DUF3818